MAKRTEPEKEQMAATAGWLCSLFTLLSKLAVEAGMTLKDIYRLATPEGENVLREMAEAMVAVMSSHWGLVMYAITVNYKLTVKQMVAALGCDGYVDLNINTENLGKEVAAKKDAKEDLNVVLFHLGREATSQEVRDEMEKRGLRPATLAELLAFGAQHPEKQREFPIAALGSSCMLDGVRQVAFLWSYLSWRSLSLRHLGHGWHATWRFLAVRK